MSDFLDASVPLSQYTQAFGDTLYMVCVALFIGSVIGIPVGVLLAITRKDGLRENRIVYGYRHVCILFAKLRVVVFCQPKGVYQRLYAPNRSRQE